MLLYSAWLLQADEAYRVGKGMTPVGAYLAQDDIIRIALEHGVDMIHPGSVQEMQLSKPILLVRRLAMASSLRTPSLLARSSKLDLRLLDLLRRSSMVWETRPRLAILVTIRLSRENVQER